MESGDLTGGALKVGQSLIHGVESGILEKGKDVAGAGVKVIQGAITDIRDTFGIHSPCDVTDEKIGVPIAQGIQAGFIRTLTDTSAMDGALDQFVHHVQGKLTSAQAKAYEALSKLVERESGFMPKLIQMSKQRGLNPDDLLNVMAIESSFNPKAHNKFGYTGLMQMGTKEAINAGTTTSAMLQMSGTQQLDYMFRYLDQRLAPLVKANAHIGLAELYATVGHGSATLNPDATFWSKGSKGYANNPLWDFNKDGRIQQWEFGPAAQTKLGAGSVFTVNGSGAVTASNPMPVRVVAVMNSAPEAARGPGPSAAGYFNQAVPGLLAYKTLGEEAKELGGDWDATNSILKDTGQIVLEVKSDTELLTTSTNNLGTSVQQIPLIPLVGEFKQVDAAITKNVANVDNLRKKYGTFSGEVLQGLKKNLKDLPTGREVVTKFVIDLPHNITDELSHAMDVGAQQGIGAALRTAGLDFAQLIKQAAFQEIEKVLTEEFIKLISWLGLSVVSDDANSTATTANTAAVTALTSAVATLTGVMASTGGGSKGGGFLDLFGSLFEGSGSVGSFGPDAFYGLATGGDFTGGGPLLVGEHGPELLFPKQPGYVMSNSDVRESLSSSKQGQPQTVNVYVNVKPDAQHRVRSSSQIAVEVYQGSAAARRNM
jgi:hypothetical protein